MKTKFDGDSNLNVNFDSSSFINSQFDAGQSSISINQVDSEEEVHIGFESSNTNLNVIFEATGGGSGESKVLYNTTAYWNSKPELISKKGVIYIYADWYEDPEHGTVAGFKVGDGVTPLIQISATDTMWLEHVNDILKHVSTDDRIRWDNKVSLDYYEHFERIIFSK